MFEKIVNVLSAMRLKEHGGNVGLAAAWKSTRCSFFFLFLFFVESRT